MRIKDSNYQVTDIEEGVSDAELIASTYVLRVTRGAFPGRDTMAEVTGAYGDTLEWTNENDSLWGFCTIYRVRHGEEHKLISQAVAPGDTLHYRWDQGPDKEAV